MHIAKLSYAENEQNMHTWSCLDITDGRILRLGQRMGDKWRILLKGGDAYEHYEIH